MSKTTQRKPKPPAKVERLEDSKASPRAKARITKRLGTKYPSAKDKAATRLGGKKGK